MLLKVSDICKYPPKTDFLNLTYDILGCKTIPPSDFIFYLKRITKYAHFEEGIYIGAMVLIKKVFENLHGFDPRLLHKYEFFLLFHLFS